MLERVMLPADMAKRVRLQVWVFLGAMVVTGALVALGAVYLASAHEGSAFTPAPEKEAVVQSLG